MAGLLKLERLVLQATQGDVKAMIAEAVDLVVFIEKFEGSRRIKEILRVFGHDGNKYETQPVGD
jgi:type IV secretion system protein VirB11